MVLSSNSRKYSKIDLVFFGDNNGNMLSNIRMRAINNNIRLVVSIIFYPLDQ
jgi:hypothetical protein